MSNEKDIFLHSSELEKSGIDPKSIFEGQKVNFQIETNEINNKSKAVNLKLVE